MSASKPPPTPEASADPPAVKVARPRKNKSPAPPMAQATGDEEPAAAMSEHPHVHVPQEGIHSWREFFVHIAIVSIGLLLAIGLQQIVETIHDRSERAQLEGQMRQSLVANEQLTADNMQKLDNLLGYLVELRMTVGARIDGRTPPPGPDESDPRNFTYFPPPSLGAYEAAKAKGTVSLLSIEKIRLYDRVGMTVGVIGAELQRYLGAMIAWRSFTERFDSSPASPHRLPQANLAQLSAEELVEYRALIGNMLGAADGFRTRMRVLHTQSRAILDGARTEDELRVAVAKLEGEESSAPAASGSNPP